MKNVMLGVIIAFLFVSTAYGAGALIRVTDKFAEVTNGTQTTEVYKLEDSVNNTVCYIGYIKRNANSTPVMSCVKVK